MRRDRQTGKEIKIFSQKHALKATACKSLPLGDNIIITNPYMNALPFVNMKTTTTTIRRTIMKSNQIMVHVALICTTSLNIKEPSYRKIHQWAAGQTLAPPTSGSSSPDSPSLIQLYVVE